MKINELPNDAFSAIIQRNFPMQQWLPLRAICKHWKTVIEEMLSAKGSLKIFPSKRSVTFYRQMLLNYNLAADGPLKLKPIGADDDLVVLKRIEGEEAKKFLEFITSLFPRLNYLVLFFSDEFEMDVPFLLSKFESLTSLALFGILEPKQYEHVFAALNSAANLIHLRIFLEEQPFAEQRIETEIPIEHLLAKLMGQLESFFTTNRGYVPLLSAINAKCTNVAVIVPDPNFIINIAALLGRPSLTANLTTLTCAFITVEQLDFICSNFSRITELSIGFNVETTFVQVLPHLNKLKALTTLRIARIEIDQMPHSNFRQFCYQNGIRPNITLKVFHTNFALSQDELRHFYMALAYLYPQLRELQFSEAFLDGGTNMAMELQKLYQLPTEKLIIKRGAQEFEYYGRHEEYFRAIAQEQEDAQLELAEDDGLDFLDEMDLDDDFFGFNDDDFAGPDDDEDDMYDLIWY